MFANRTEAGILLVKKLQKYKSFKDGLVLAIPRGGVVIGKAVSDALGISLGVVYAKKIPTPGQPELAAGARIIRTKKFGKTPEVKDKEVILVDDGIATGETVKAAIKYLKRKKARKIILAVPVVPEDTFQEVSKLVAKAITLETPAFFGAVGEFYRDFPQVSDEVVVKLLKPS